VTPPKDLKIIFQVMRFRPLVGFCQPVVYIATSKPTCFKRLF